jgi:hypothetical protein
VSKIVRTQSDIGKFWSPKFDDGIKREIEVAIANLARVIVAGVEVRADPHTQWRKTCTILNMMVSGMLAEDFDEWAEANFKD